MCAEARHSRFLLFWTAALLLAASVFIGGCASAPQAAAGSPSPPAAAGRLDDGLHDLALQHFIDGSVFELRGDHARSVLEYQEALQYEKNHAIYFALSRAYAMLGKNVQAIEAGREAVRLKPGNVEYRKNLAAVFLSAMEPDSALATYEEIVRRDSASIESWFNLARLYQVRAPLKALETYRRITERFGPEWEVLAQQAELASKLGRFDTAAAALRQMVGIDPTNRELKRTLGQTYMRAGQVDSALAVYTALREADSTSLDLLMELGGVQLARKEYGRAAREFDRVLASDTVGLETKLRIGELYFGQSEKDSTIIPHARRIFERIRAGSPGDWRAYWFLGAIGTLEKDDSAAVRNFRKVTELASWNADGWVYLSGVFLNRNNYAEVARILESALKVLPNDFKVNFFLGVALNRMGRNPEAVERLEHARSINSRDVDVTAQLALVYENMHRYDEADSLYEEALRMDPANALVLNNYSYSLAERNVQLDKALAMAKQAVTKEPRNASYLDTIGWIYYRLGEYSQAVTYVREAIALGEANATVYEHLGDIYYKMNDTQGALEQWNMALHLDSGNSALREKISRGSN